MGSVPIGLWTWQDGTFRNGMAEIYHRLDFMRPNLIRVVHNTAELMKDGKLNPMKILTR